MQVNGVGAYFSRVSGVCEASLALRRTAEAQISRKSALAFSARFLVETFALNADYEEHLLMSSKIQNAGKKKTFELLLKLAIVL